MLLLDGGGEPGGLDLAGLDAGIAHGLLEGLHHQILGVAIPPLAEARAAHAEDDDLVADAACHGDS